MITAAALGLWAWPPVNLEASQALELMRKTLAEARPALEVRVPERQEAEDDDDDLWLSLDDEAFNQQAASIM